MFSIMRRCDYDISAIKLSQSAKQPSSYKPGLFLSYSLFLSNWSPFRNLGSGLLHTTRDHELFFFPSYILIWFPIVHDYLCQCQIYVDKSNYLGKTRPNSSHLVKICLRIKSNHFSTKVFISKLLLHASSNQ